MSEPAELLRELQWQRGAKAGGEVQPRYQPASEKEAIIIEILGRDSLHLDELAETCGLTLPELSPILLALELQGVIERMPGSRYQIRAE